MLSACPKCGSRNLRFSNRQSVLDRILSVFGYCAVRCRDCDHRYREGILWLPGMGYARCPRCLREDLCDWEERYYYPPRWQQALLHFGAKAQRCGACRVNFVSFKRRRREFEPSWRRKPAGANPETPPAPPESAKPAAAPTELPVGNRRPAPARGIEEKTVA